MKTTRLAIVTSNHFPLSSQTKKGTEIFVYHFVNELLGSEKNLEITVFCSKDSEVQVPIESVDEKAECFDKNLPADKHILFELALISKAFRMDRQFDLYHINIGNGDIALPFASFTQKPIVITVHYTLEGDYAKRYFGLFNDLKHVHFVAPSAAQASLIPNLNYAAIIHHGINLDKFPFDTNGGNSIMWAGRMVEEKGLDAALDVVEKTGKTVQIYGIMKEKYDLWLKSESARRIKNLSETNFASFFLNKHQEELVRPYQSSRLFLFPIRWEEPFGQVVVEAMSCGTPVVSYARGAAPEIIEDGKTGYLVNFSKSDIRGKWIVQKTGVEGLREAVERIFALGGDEYKKMRKNCRSRVEDRFSVERMAREYVKVYETVMDITL